jgi:hypothetical protein
LTFDFPYTPLFVGGRRGRRWVWIALAAALGLAALLRVTITDPRVHVRWTDSLAADDQTSRERSYGLHDGVRLEGPTNTWRYELGDLSRDNIRALLEDAAVLDVAYLDPATLSSEGRLVEVTLRYPYSDLVDSPRDLWPLHRSVWLLLAGGVLLSTARLADVVRRRRTTVATLLLVGALMTLFPHDPAFVTMGGSADHVRSRTDFEEWFGGRVRFEKHLSQVMLLRIYEHADPTDHAPVQALTAMTRIGTAWFVAGALGIGVLESWSPVVLRYLGLALLAPSALLYFGWRELGYLSLNVAAFPLLLRGMRERGMRLEAGSTLTGLGAALHGSGLVALTGAVLAAVAARGPLPERAGRLLRVTAWGTAAYVGWIAIYIIIFKLPISPDPGPVVFSSWRPWSVGDVRAGRVAAAILSPAGARDLAMSMWIVGAPLLAVALSLWRRYPHEVRTALWYLPPSLLFVVFRWPFEGVGGGMDLVVAGFPAFFALAWACAHDERRSRLAALLLASAHYGFWRVVLDPRFEP